MANPNLNNESEFLNSADKEFENTIRPSAIIDFSGQPQIIENIVIFINHRQSSSPFQGESLQPLIQT